MTNEFEAKYLKVMEVLNAADDAGLFDLKTSQVAHVDPSHRVAIRSLLREETNRVVNEVLGGK